MIYDDLVFLISSVESLRMPDAKIRLTYKQFDDLRSDPRIGAHVRPEEFGDVRTFMGCKIILSKSETDL